MKNTVKIFCISLLVIFIFSFRFVIYADDSNSSSYPVLVNYGGYNKGFNTLEEAVEFINENYGISKAEIVLSKKCYISKTIIIEEDKNIQITATGDVEIVRKNIDIINDKYFDSCMFKTMKNSVLSFGTAEGMDKGSSITVNGGAKWKDDNISENVSIVADEAMIVMCNGTVNIFDDVKFINNDCISRFGSAFYIERGCLNFYGGEVTKNRSKCGAAIFTEYGNVCIYGGDITENYSEDYGNVYVQFGSSISIKDDAYIYDNYEDKNIYLENTYIDIVGRLSGKIGVSTYKTTLSTLIAYSDNKDFLDLESIIYDMNLGIYDLYTFDDNTIRIGAQTKIFTEMPIQSIYEYDGEKKTVEYYVKQYSQEDGNIIVLAKCSVEYYERNGNRRGKQLVNEPSSVGDYYVDIIYGGNNILGYASCVKTEKFSIKVINQNTDNYYFNLSLENKNNIDEALITCVEIIPASDVTLLNTIEISKNIIEKALRNASDYLIDKENRDIVLKIDSSSNYENSKLSLDFDHSCFDSMLDYNINYLCIDKGNTKFSISNNGIYTIYTETEEVVSICIEKLDSSNFTKEVKKLVYNRPIYDYSISYKMTNRYNKEAIIEIDDFDKNDILLSIKYDLDKSILDRLDYIKGKFNNNNRKHNNIYFIKVYDDDYELIKYKTYNKENNTFSMQTDSTGVIGIARKYDGNCFDDISNHWACKDIELMVELEIFAGINTKEFKPDNQMTRGMFVTVLGRVAQNSLNVNIDTSGSIKCAFIDVKNDKYYTPYINWAVNAKIVSGTGNNCFNPDEPITREEMCVILSNFIRAYNCEVKEVNGRHEFEDEDLISSWALDSIYEMQILDIVRGSNNRFNPKKQATRAEISVLINRLIRIIVK